MVSAGLAARASAQTDDAPATDEPADAGADEAGADEAGADEAGADEAGADEAAADETPDAPEGTTGEEPTGSDLAAPQVEGSGEGEAGEGEAGEGEAGEGEAGEGEAGEGEEEAPASEPLPWRSTFFSWTHQATFNSFLRDAQLTYDPTYQQNFSLSPRWYVAPMTFFWANVSLSLELTDDDFNALNHDPQFGDTLVELRHMIPWEGFIFIAQARIGIPTSKASIASQRYLQTGLGATVVRIIPEINTTLAGIFAYRRWWAGSNMLQVGEPQPDRCPAAPPPTMTGGGSAPEINTTSCDQLGTPSAARDTILAGLSATTSIDNFSISLSAFIFTLYGYELAPAYIDVATSENPIQIDDGSPSHWRNFTYVSLAVAYQFTPWLNLSLGIQNAGNVAPAYNPDGSIRNPIFTPDTQVFLSATVGLDSVYDELFGEEEEGLTPEQLQRRRQGLASGPRTGGSF
jgi:hypothetical protein